ncbi:hypothetical protein, partial [Klebsiella pneumoniae]|uniref:hypothetical protein n=1 Tax=Klebsiella pneumoniae TaxID=573 RepID=UPI00210D6D65
EKSERVAHQPTSTYSVSMTSMVWNTSFGQFGSTVLAMPLSTSYTCTLVKPGKLEDVLGPFSNN